MTLNQPTPPTIVAFHFWLSDLSLRTVIIVGICGSFLTTGCGSNAEGQASKPVSAETTAAYDQHLVNANALFKQQKFDDALAELRTAGKLDPGRYEAFATEALILHTVGNPRLANEAVQKAIERAPKEKEEKVLLIAELLAAKNQKDSGSVASATASVRPSAKDSLPPEFVSFIKDKETHARELVSKLNLTVAPEVWSYIQLAATNTPTAITNAFERLRKGAGQYDNSEHEAGISTPIFQIPLEIELVAEAFVDGAPRHAIAFGWWVVDSLPQGSVYFGGTDPGRGLPTALSRSHARGDPIFTITQNAFANGHYLDYLRATYGDKIRIPSAADAQQAFQEYITDAQKRLEHDRQFPNEPRQIKPGEDVRIADNRVHVTGQVSVMSINAILAEKIFKTNPDREFYIEESFPLDWMNPHLSPYGFIFRLNRTPFETLDPKTVEQDRQFWLKQQEVLIGSWLTSNTTVEAVCSFALKVHQKRDFTGFSGDQGFIESGYSCKHYSKLRSSIGRLYAWHAGIHVDPAERRRLSNEAAFAFRQAFAFYPASPEVVFQWINLLAGQGQWDDAFRVADTARLLDPKNPGFANLAVGLEKARISQREKTQTLLDQLTNPENRPK